MAADAAVPGRAPRSLGRPGRVVPATGGVPGHRCQRFCCTVRSYSVGRPGGSICRAGRRSLVPPDQCRHAGLGRRADPQCGHQRRQGQQQLGAGGHPHREWQTAAGQRPAPGPVGTRHLVLCGPAGAGRPGVRRHPHGRHRRGGCHLARHAFRGAGPHGQSGLGLHQHGPGRAGPVPGADQPRRRLAVPHARGLGALHGAQRNHPCERAGRCCPEGAQHAARPRVERRPEIACRRAGPRQIRAGAALERARCRQPDGAGGPADQPGEIGGRVVRGPVALPLADAERGGGR